jgi:Leucine-rich repeat (LRR) protein
MKNVMRCLKSSLVFTALAIVVAHPPNVHACTPCRTALADSLEYLKKKNPTTFPSNYTVAQLATLESLDLGTHQVTDSELDNLCPLVNLKQLFLFNDGFDQSLTGRTLDRLGGMNRLECLDLDANRISARELWRLAPLQSLKELRLYHNPIGPEGIEALLFLSNLEKADFYVDNLTDADMPQFSALQFHQSLKTLDISGNAISDAGLKYLSGLNSVESIDLSGNLITTGEGLRYVAEMRGLRTLLLMGPSFAHLSGNRNHVVAKNLELLNNAPSLTTLSLLGLSVTDDDLAHVAKISKLIYLDLQGNLIKGYGLRDLRSLTRLQTLIIPSTIPMNDPAIADLKAALPALEVRYYPKYAPPQPSPCE